MSASAALPFERVRRRERLLPTPEGVPLRVAVAEPGERIVAFIADILLSFAGALALVLVGLLLSAVLAPLGSVSFTLPILLFLSFVVRNAYFLIFELKWGGVTPGKRMAGLRVIDRRGGPLLPSAVVARNLTRQAEIFPIELLLVTHGWLWSLGDIAPPAIWIGGMFALLFGTRDRLRLGDLVGGTMVISAPKRVLLEDLARDSRIFEFSADQLQAYGIRELQVLEEVLRQPPNAENFRLMCDIRDRVVRRIGWTGKVADRDVGTFLRDFYTAQRAFLEQRKNFGDERNDKYYQTTRGPT
ncbi:MAG: RDD family protein [Bryobacteraceae bacterium]